MRAFTVSPRLSKIPPADQRPQFSVLAVFAVMTAACVAAAFPKPIFLLALLFPAVFSGVTAILIVLYVVVRAGACIAQRIKERPARRWMIGGKP